MPFAWTGASVPAATTVSRELAGPKVNYVRQRNEAERSILQFLGDSTRMKRIVRSRLRHTYSANPRIHGTLAFKVHEGGDSAEFVPQFLGGGPPPVRWRAVVDTTGQGPRDREICQALATPPDTLKKECARLMR